MAGRKTIAGSAGASEKVSMKEILKLIAQTKSSIEGGRIRKEKYLNFLREYFRGHKLNETCNAIGEKPQNVSRYMTNKQKVSEEKLAVVCEKILLFEKKRD